MHHPGFAILIWAIDIFGALLLLRLVVMASMTIRGYLRGRRIAGVGFYWRAYRELAFLYFWNVVVTLAALALLYWLFGAPRWLRGILA